jgi:hypothetical protein
LVAGIAAIAKDVNSPATENFIAAATRAISEKDFASRHWAKRCALNRFRVA